MNPKKKPVWNDAQDRLLNKYKIPRRGPTWTHDFLYPLRLEQFAYGVIYNHNTGMSLSGAQAEMTVFEMKQMRDSGFDHVAYSFTIEETATARNDPTIPKAHADTIQFTVRRLLEYGFNVIIKIDSTGQLRQDLCGDNGTVGVWTQANYNKFLINLYSLVMEVPLVTPERVWLGTGNEMGLNCTNRSMTYYNGFLASVVPALRAAFPKYTILYDLYPTATPLDYRWDEQYANPPGTPGYVTMVRPTDKNTLASCHYYWQNMFALDQGKNDTSPSGMRWIYGFPWGLNRAEFMTWMSTYTNGGQYHTGNALLDAQIDWWRNVNNVATVVDSNGINNLSLYNQIAGLIAWCTTNLVPLYFGEHGTADITQSSNFTPAEADLTRYTFAVTSMAVGYGCGYCIWQWSNLADGVSGSRIANATALARNAGKRALVRGIRSL